MKVKCESGAPGAAGASERVASPRDRPFDSRNLPRGWSRFASVGLRPYEHLFPGLTDALVARVAARGRRGAMAVDEVLIEAGTSSVPFFVIVSSTIEIARPAREGDTLVLVPGANQFAGEVEMLAGRRTVVPVLICCGELVLKNPSNAQIADCLGFNDSIDAAHLRDLVIVGAGPSGLAAAA